MDNNEFAASIFNKLAKEYQDKFMDVALYGDTFDFFCDHVEVQDAQILEIACGPGNITKYLLSKRPELKILGIDLAPNMIALAEINNPQAQFQVMDCRNIASIDQKFDGIMCGFCLPYLSKAETVQLIADASSLLKTNGLLYLSTMEDDYSTSGLRKGSAGDEVYMHYYRADDLIPMLQQHYFEVLNLTRKDFPTTDGSQVTDLIIIAQKKPLT
ncbi:trans-aconitate 2-methyltransferase [Pedobacter sp. Hv1]|uniref:class I SAM-dependent methyltransferase n=1 Tax=Pedobacter sp. Hv1 TaxID=1740090 RepID=UPI0006D89E74|nr:class I SAM-dependent methyltransferase [Pedobacter sp. Hv1]KQC00213.1 methyltransferase type 11 [Pedobacter sp. Hv1]